MHARMHARTHARTYTLTHTLARTHARTHLHAYTHGCTRARSHLFAFAFGRRSSTACAFAAEPTCVASWGICNMVRLLHVALSCNQQGELQWIRPGWPVLVPRHADARNAGAQRPRLHQEWARPCHLCAPATSASGLGSALPRSPLNWAHRWRIYTDTGLTSPTSAPGLGHPGHISPGLGSSLPHCDICRYSMRAERCKVLRTYLRRNNRPRNNVTPKGHNIIRTRCLRLSRMACIVSHCTTVTV
jgi:hypothetical protein